MEAITHRCRFSRSLTALALAATAAPVLAQSGLRVGERDVDWPRWQARIGIATAPVGGSTSLAGLRDGSGGLQLRGAQLLGDYYFSGSGLVPRGSLGGGFRATSGLLFGARHASVATGGPGGLSLSSLRSTVAAGEDGAAMPYVGLGYTGWSIKGFSFTADLGLVARGGGNGLRLRSANGSAADDWLREPRLEPTLQLGVSYSF